MKKLLLLLLLTSSFSAYAADSLPPLGLPCESKDITKEVESFLEGIDIEEQKAKVYYFIAEQFLRNLDERYGGIQGYHCCSNSSLEVCQELKEAE